MLADLLTVPGASATVLDARVPYAQRRARGIHRRRARAGVQRRNGVRHRDGGVSTRALTRARRRRNTASASVAPRVSQPHRRNAANIARTLRCRRLPKRARGRSRSPKVRAIAPAEERLLADIALTAFAETFALQANLHARSAMRAKRSTAIAQRAGRMGRHSARPRSTLRLCTARPTRPCCSRVRSIRCTTATSRWRSYAAAHLRRTASRSKSAPTMSISRA